MPIDPRDFLSGSSLSLDSSLVTASMTHALATSRLDPMKGIGIAVDTGLAMRSLFTPTTGPWELGLRHTLDAATSLTSLAQLRRPYDALSASSAYEPFKGTISSLAATSGLATSLVSILKRSVCGHGATNATSFEVLSGRVDCGRGRDAAERA